MNDNVQQEIQAKGPIAPHVTAKDVEDAIREEHYFTAAHGRYGATGADVEDGDPLLRYTFCTLVLRNGALVAGESFFVSPEDFDAEAGRKIARHVAVQKAATLMSCMLSEQS